MAVFLVRHALAKSRSSWDGDDDLRPLTGRGRRQAAGIAAALGAHPVRRITSSPSRRCVDTVAPLAEALGVGIVLDDQLAEGHAAKAVTKLLLHLAGEPGDSVLCTHGDLIPPVLGQLEREGLRLPGDSPFAKGSTWQLAVEGGTVTGADYLPPPA